MKKSWQEDFYYNPKHGMIPPTGQKLLGYANRHPIYATAPDFSMSPQVRMFMPAEQKQKKSLKDIFGKFVK